jgi:ribosomal protein L16 Arg81 hydroxylase
MRFAQTRTAKVDSVWPFLLNQIEVAEFFSDYWTKNYCYIPSDENRLTKIMTWASYEALVTRCYPAFNQNNIRVIANQRNQPFSKISKGILTKSGVVKQVCLDSLSKQLREGATFVLRGVRHFSESIAALAQRIETETGCRVGTNIYHTPPCFQGFLPHFDTHDIFVLQLEGIKEWKLEGFTRMYPTKFDSCNDFPLANPKSNSVTTKRGDILYIPRGLWHSAKACSEASLHLSIGIHCPTGVELVSAVVKTTNEIEALRRDLMEFRDGKLQLSPAKVALAISALHSKIVPQADINNLMRELIFQVGSFKSF